MFYHTLFQVNGSVIENLESCLYFSFQDVDKEKLKDVNQKYEKTNNSMTLYVYVTMKYFDSDMPNSTNTVVYFDGKGGNLYICLRAR